MIPKITEAEEIVMRALWGYEPSTLSEVCDRIRDAKWSSKTIKTLIDRLCDKNAVGIERWGRRNRYYALIEKEAFVDRQIEQMTDRLFDGSTSDMLAYFCKTRSLTPGEAQLLIELLEERKDEK